MDFIKKYKIDMRWNEWGDYFMYDTVAKISTLLEFIRVPKNLPRVTKISLVSALAAAPPLPEELVHPLDSDSPDWQIFQVAAIKSIEAPGSEQAVPQHYLKLIQKYPSLLNPDFRSVKHSV